MAAPAVPRLPLGELHLWHASLDLPVERADSLERCLSADERERARRRKLEIDRLRYVAARGLLRRLLAGYLEADPIDLGLAYGPKGKPEMAAGPHAGAIRFNVSHSGALALYAVTRHAGVGVDLERVRPVSNPDRVARRVFPDRELEDWRALPADQRLEGFFVRWTRLEAVAKLHGGGVWWLAAQGGTLPDDEHVTLLDVEAPAGYLAAAAVGGEVTAVRQMLLPDDL
jgi:4'-phosphopantetheinyl transferase